MRAHPPEAEIGKRHDGVPADAQQLAQYDFRPAGRLDGLRQNHKIKTLVGIVEKVRISITLNHGNAF